MSKPDYGYTPEEANQILDDAQLVTRPPLEIPGDPEAPMFGTLERNPESLGKYLKLEGYGRHFKIREIVTPHHKGIAKRCGYTEFVPPVHLWPFVAIVLMLGDIMRETVGRSIKLRNLWRPVPYNVIVAHTTRARSLKGDHSNACAGDFDFQDITDRRKAEGAIRAISILHPALKISLGMGGRSLHVGVLSPRGHRQWYYKSYRKERKVKLR